MIRGFPLDFRLREDVLLNTGDKLLSYNSYTIYNDNASSCLIFVTEDYLEIKKLGVKFEEVNKFIVFGLWHW